MRATPVSTTYRMPGTVSEVSATLVASTTRRPECGSKTLCCSAAESREYSGSTSSRSSARQGVSGVADLPLARQEDQDVARPLRGELLHRVDDRLGLVAHDRLALLVGLGDLDERAVADLDRVGAAGDLHDRRVEVLREPVEVDGRGRDDQLQVRAPRQQPLEIAEQEVDVEAALVRLVDDDRVVAAQLPVALELGEQDAVGHHLDPAGPGGAVGEPHLVADQVAQLGAELFGDPLGHRPRRDPPRLGVPDHPAALAGPPRPSSRQIFGSWVVFPEPVSPATITTWWSRIAAAMSSRRWLTGSSGG